MNPDKIKRFFKGESSAEEVHEILIWINSQEGRKYLESEFDEFLGKDASIDTKSSEKIRKELFEKINAGRSPIDEVERQDRILKDTSSNRGAGSGLYRQIKPLLVACIAACCLILWFLSLSPFRKNHDKMMASQVVEMMERSVPKGQKLRLKLSDGSEVYLNSMSTLKFPKSFSDGSREVHLEGEAFFTVTHDPQRPFIVHSQGIQTQVIGTSFTIKGGGGKPALVAVLTGKVQVALSGQDQPIEERGLILEPMDAASIDYSGNTLRKFRVEYDDIFAWKDNVISFKNASFQDIISRLEIWYDVEINVQKPLKSPKDYTGKFENQTLEEVLTGLSFVYGFQFKIEKTRVSIN